MHIHGSGFDPVPELDSSASPVVPQNIDGDTGEPCAHAALAAKTVPAVVGSQQRVLGNRLGEVRVPGRICDKANDSCPMGSRKGVDIVELANGPDPPGHARFYPRVGDRA